MKESIVKSYDELPLFLNADMLAKVIEYFMEDILGKEMKPWQDEKTDKEQ